MSLWPAVIDSYNAETRKVRIRMAGMTDGDNLLPESDLLYSLGDDSEKTEIEIIEGAAVWIDFMAGDERYPIIMGYRNPEQGNMIDWRKWHHKNVEISADALLNTISGGKTHVKAMKIELEAGEKPMYGVVNGGCLCPFTGEPHNDISTVVIASK